ncbi:MAG: fibronectin type III domain-containing protein [Oscillospiraceae bacterium]|nr:fibronectin type III domain-containing protein [Oscillospiraceae bacterium]
MIQLNPHAIAISDHTGTAAYSRERSVRPEFDYILAALVDPLNDYERNISHAPSSGFIRDKIYIPSTTPEALALYEEFSETWTDGNGVARGRIGPQGNIIGPFMGGRRGMDPGQSGHDTPGNRIRNIQRPGVVVAGPDEFPLIDNHNFPNSWFPSNRYPFSSPESTTARDWRSLLGDSMEDLHTTINGVTVNAVANRAADTITFTGSSYEDIFNQFQIYAQEFLFHDGLPLIPPTPSLVNEMLTGTSRHRDEVIGGKIPGRSGETTVEKIAINAVMAGALPEHLPLILAAIEMWSHDNANRTTHFHGLTSGGPFGYALFVSGPIVSELGLHTGAGYIGGAGHSVNNTIGRATRLNTRNIGNNWLGYQDTPRLGRLHEIIHPVIAEDESALPAGWAPSRVQMGFSAQHSVISIHSIGNHNMIHTDSAGIDQQWDAHSLIRHLRTQNDRGTDLMIVIGPAHAQALYDAGWTNVNALRMNTTTDALPFPPGFTNGLGNNNAAQTGAGGAGAAALNNTWIVVTGEDPTRATSYGSNSHGNGMTFGTQRITGAPLSNVVNCLPPPSTPTNFAVVPGSEPGTAILSWDLPEVIAGRLPITHFEVTAQSERNDVQRWVEVPGGAAARSAALTHLDGGNNYTFRVRAVSGSYTDANPETMYYLGGRRVPLMNGAVIAPAATGAAGVIGVQFPPVNVYTGWDTNAFSTGLATVGHQLGIVPARGAIASIQWYTFTNGNGVSATGPSEVFYITASLNADAESIDIRWRSPMSDGGDPILGYEFSTDNGRTWAAMSSVTGRNLVLPTVTGATVENVGVRHNGRFTIEVDSDTESPLILGETYDILVRAYNSVGHGAFAGQSIALGEGTAWPFQTHHRGAANAQGPQHNNLAGANNAFIQAISRVRITVTDGSFPVTGLALVEAYEDCEDCGECENCEAYEGYAVRYEDCVDYLVGTIGGAMEGEAYE